MLLVERGTTLENLYSQAVGSNLHVNIFSKTMYLLLHLCQYHTDVYFALWLWSLVENLKSVCFLSQDKPKRILSHFIRILTLLFCLTQSQTCTQASRFRAL